MNYFPRLASSLDPPDRSHPGSWDYRREPLHFLTLCALAVWLLKGA
jgi:hypothetical protein